MPSNIDPEMLNRLLPTVRSSIPTVISGIESFFQDTSQYEALEDAYQSMHSIRDVASLLGLTLFFSIANSVIEMIESIAAEQVPVSSVQNTHLLEVVNQIEPYLQSLQDGDSQEEVIAAKALIHKRRFLDLPEDGDEDEIAKLFVEQDINFNSVNPQEETASYGTHEFGDDFDLPMDFSAELLEGFLVEAEDYLDIIGSLLPEVDGNAQQNNQLQQIRRSVHTLKGSAGVVGLQTVSLLAHRMEDLLDDLYDGRLSLTAQIKEVMISTFDVLEDFIRDKRGQGDIETAAQSLYSIYDQILGADTTSVDQNDDMSSDEQTTFESSEDSNVSDEWSEQNQDDNALSQSEVAKAGVPQSESVRVPIDRLDEMVRLVGELVISRSVFEQHFANLTHQIDELHLSIERLQRTSTTLETQYEVSALVGGHSFSGNSGAGLNRAGAEWTGIVEFDELEFDRYSDFHLMSRDLTETSADIGALGTEFREVLSEFDAYLTRQSRLTSEIQDKLMNFRMVPLATLSTRLHRAVRVTAKQRRKEVSLIVEGEEVQFDKTMLDELNEALLHILRNAVDHGIEAPSDRAGVGKNPAGTVHLQAFREGTQIVVRIQDDGAGLNPQRIRSKAIENGLVSEAEIETWQDEQVYPLIFAPGLSTAKEVSEVSGRGVGMDIVHEIVSRLKGRIAIDSSLGHGTTLTIRLPLTLALTQVLLVEANNQTFAVPLADVIQVLHIETSQIEQISGMKVVSINNKITPVVSLSEALNIGNEQSTSEDRFPIIVAQAGNQQIGLVVDQLLGGREVVVKTLGSHLHHIHGLIGSTLMGDGSIVLILNPSELVHEKEAVKRTPLTQKTHHAARTSEAFEILVVDDSFSVRRVVANLVKKAGWQPILAKNGLEALEIIQRASQLPDLILLDVEMPQMDGYELTSTLRANPAYQDIPIVMLTSRSGDKHRQKAFEVGATEYVIKPYRDAVLLNLVGRVISQSRGASAARS